MFTGLIEDVGVLNDVRTNSDHAVVAVSTSLPMTEITLGESIAVNGVCLTVTSFGNGVFTADVSPETVKRTTLGRLSRGTSVSLERALRLSDRLGGHLVTGHVDGLATIVERRQEGNAWFFRFQVDPTLVSVMIEKGSVAIDGISLTVNEVKENSFSVAIIPHTLKMTSLQDRKVGDEVNIETDLIGKYVARFMSSGGDEKPAGVTLDVLAKHGFL